MGQYQVARRLPVKILNVQLDGDYAGMEFRARSIKVKEFQQFQEEQQSAVGLAPTIKLLSKIIMDWNIGDEEGNTVEPSAEAIGELPLELLNEMASAYFKATTAGKDTATA